MRILCTGDVHIGRTPSLPESVDAQRFSCAQSWTSAVDAAIDRHVDLVALTGDVVDRENRYFEAFGPLESGVRKLEQAGIPVVAVAGNHDFDVLPRLAESLASNAFRLLGAGGRWERYTFERNGEAIHLDGWSIPTLHFHGDPLHGYDLGEGGGAPVIGLVHADLDQPGSPYAPVASADLRRLPPVAWLLGHVHAGRLSSEPGQADILYPGSPQPLSAREPGVHGPWLIEIGQEGRITAQQIPLASVRYEAVPVDVDGIASLGDVERRITETLRGRLAELVSEGTGVLERLICRLRLTGRTPVHRSIQPRLAEFARDLVLQEAKTQAVIDRWTVDTRPLRDLKAIAAGSGPPAILAEMLLELQDGTKSERTERLLQLASRRLQDLRTARYYRALPGAGAESDGEGEALRQRIEQQGLRLLDELLAQKEGA